jgi:hypothetical protein
MCTESASAASLRTTAPFPKARRSWGRSSRIACAAARTPRGGPGAPRPRGAPRRRAGAGGSTRPTAATTSWTWPVLSRTEIFPTARAMS